METRKKQEIILEVYKELWELCSRERLRLIASSGTLIGLNRHGGFIPWDDDMDLMMMPDEYEKLKSIVTELENKKVKVIIEEASLGIPFIKIIILNDEITVKSWKTREYDGLGIDIFKLDFLKEKQTKKIKGRKWWYLIAHFGLAKEFKPTNLKAKILYLVIKILGLFIPNKKKYIQTEYKKMVSHKQTEYMGYASRPDDLRSKTIINFKDISTMKATEFEDTYVYNPVGFDEILTKEYGKWRKPKEVPQHTE